ncbi:hypothetical protein CPB83DRAFT_366914 [Crepidotus variabilis]|uniref:Uncharacterized protein n=1 Tax=Crepidotus variabilis TaxID=179855 RepID=A0A9P6BC59_9AGAR|nr:hypothetical protein CPB83DRAFT_366914 [Crepidotus variabilis]
MAPWIRDLRDSSTQARRRLCFKMLRSCVDFEFSTLATSHHVYNMTPTKTMAVWARCQWMAFFIPHRVVGSEMVLVVGLKFEGSPRLEVVFLLTPQRPAFPPSTSPKVHTQLRQSSIPDLPAQLERIHIWNATSQHLDHSPTFFSHPTTQTSSFPTRTVHVLVLKILAWAPRYQRSFNRRTDGRRQEASLISLLYNVFKFWLNLSAAYWKASPW